MFRSLRFLRSKSHQVVLVLLINDEVAGVGRTDGEWEDVTGEWFPGLSPQRLFKSLLDIELDVRVVSHDTGEEVYALIQEQLKHLEVHLGDRESPVSVIPIGEVDIHPYVRTDELSLVRTSIYFPLPYKDRIRESIGVPPEEILADFPHLNVTRVS